MARNAATGCLLSASILTLAACASNSKPAAENPNLYPSNYKKEVPDTMRQILSDFARVRTAFISDPVLSPVGADQRYTLCVRVTWQDAKGNSGTDDRIAYFYAGRLSQLVDATTEQCNKAAYKPFPEMLVR